MIKRFLLFVCFVNCWDTGIPYGLLSKSRDVMKLKRVVRKDSRNLAKREGKEVWNLIHLSVSLNLYDAVYGHSSVWVLVSLSMKGGPWTRSHKAILASFYALSDLFWLYLLLPAPCPLLLTPCPHLLFLESKGLALLGGRDGDWSKAVEV